MTKQFFNNRTRVCADHHVPSKICLADEVRSFIGVGRHYEGLTRQTQTEKKSLSQDRRSRIGMLEVELPLTLQQGNSASVIYWAFDSNQRRNLPAAMPRAKARLYS